MSRIRVKMCGMTRKEDIQHAVAIGADAIGLIFYPNSSRFVTLETATEITRAIPPFIDTVAVFVNPSVDEVKHVLGLLTISMLQFHGEEPASFCEQFAKPYIKAVSATSTQHILEISQQHPNACALLIDTPSEKQKGGSGQTFDWQKIPPSLTLPTILAGGLHAGNVSSAIRDRTLHAVDVCSGIESTAGIKDHKKMMQFIQALASNN
jgi:phosphoribosylanthranilate isomerase